MMTLNDRGISKPPLDLQGQKLEHPDIVDDRFWELLERVHGYTELPTAVLFNLYSVVRYVSAAEIPGDIIECGVHMGGSIMMIEHALLDVEKSSTRKVFALDTFTGFVRRTEGLDIDLRSGADVCHPEEGTDYTNGAIENMESVGYKGLEVVKGDVLKTIPTLEVSKIALLRLDTDTYDTTKFELEQLYDRVVPGGVVIVDDYGYTIGCKKAVDDFVASRKILLQRINANVRAWVKVP
jgi:O-methyltransferase